MKAASLSETSASCSELIGTSMLSRILFRFMQTSMLLLRTRSDMNGVGLRERTGWGTCVLRRRWYAPRKRHHISCTEQLTVFRPLGQAARDAIQEQSVAIFFTPTNKGRALKVNKRKSLTNDNTVPVLRYFLFIPIPEIRLSRAQEMLLFSTQ